MDPLYCACTPKDIKIWVVKQMDLIPIVFQIMAPHQLHIKESMDGQKEITHDFFLTDQECVLSLQQKS